MPSIRRFVWTGRLPFNARASRREEMTATTMTTASTTREFRRASRRNWCSDGEEAKRTEAEERARKSGGRVANVRVCCVRTRACVCAYGVCGWKTRVAQFAWESLALITCDRTLRLYIFSVDRKFRSTNREKERTHETRLRPHSPSLLPLPLSLSLSLVSFFPSRAEHRPRSCAPGKTRGKFTTGGMNISGI